MSIEHKELEMEEQIESEEPEFGIEELESVEDVEEIGGKVEPEYGIVTDCVKLNIRTEPNIKSDVICTVDVDEELMIDSANSTDGWFNVFTKAGIEGFCMKEYVSIKE